MANKSKTPEVDDWQDIDDWQDVEEGNGPGYGETLARSVADSASFGFSDEIAGALKNSKGALKQAAKSIGVKIKDDNDLKEYLLERDRQRKLNDEAAAANPKTHFAGQMLPALFTGGSTAARGAGQAVIKAALGGGLYGAGSSDEDSVMGIAKDAAIGGTIGGVASGIPLGVAKGASKLRGAKEILGEAVDASPLEKLPGKLDDFAENQAVRAMGATDADIKGLRHQKRLNDVGRFALDEKIVTPLTRKSNIAERSRGINKEAGRSLGEAEEALDKKLSGLYDDSLGFVPSETGKRVGRELIDPIRMDPAKGGLVPELAKIVARLKAYSKGGISFKEAGTIKRNFDDMLDWQREQSPSRELTKRIRGIVGDDIKQAGSRVSRETGDPKEFLGWLKANKRYGDSREIVDISQEAADRTNKSGILQDVGFGLLGGGIQGLSSEDPRSGLQTGLLLSGLARGKRAFGNSLAATGANRLSKSVRKLPNRLESLEGFLSNKASSPYAGQAGLSVGKALATENDNGETKENDVPMDDILRKLNDAAKKLGRGSASNKQEDGGFDGSGLAHNLGISSQVIRERMRPSRPSPSPTAAPQGDFNAILEREGLTKPIPRPPFGQNDPWWQTEFKQTEDGIFAPEKEEEDLEFYGVRDESDIDKLDAATLPEVEDTIWDDEEVERQKFALRHFLRRKKMRDLKNGRR